MCLEWLLVVPVLLGFLVCWYANNTFGTWKKKGIPYLKPKLFFGNLEETFLGKEHFGRVLARLYQQLNGHDFGGIFFARTPYILLRSPEIIKAILVKDFQYFRDRTIRINFDLNPLEQHPFHVKGDQWKWVRSKVGYSFASGKMKSMFELMDQSLNDLLNVLQQFGDCGNPVNVRGPCDRFVMDAIVTWGFGVDCASATKVSAEFLRYAQLTVSPGMRLFMQMAGFMGYPDILGSLPVRIVRPEVHSFVVKALKDVIAKKKKKDFVQRGDFIDNLMKMQAGGNYAKPGSNLGSISMTDELLMAQCYSFLTGGYETTSATISFCLMDLSVHPQVQEKLREEIQTVLMKHDNKISYEAILEMPYLEMVINESLRMNPPITMVLRECTKDYRIPGSNLSVEKGTKVIVPILGLHFDPQHYPDPYRFDPERFNEQNTTERHSYAHLPFGQGPRICVGMRFSMWLTKIALVGLLSKFRFTPGPKTTFPLRMDPRSIILCPVDGIWLNVSTL